MNLNRKQTQLPKRRFYSISNILSLFLALVLLAPGCTHDPLAPGHHIAIDPDGRPIGQVDDRLQPLKVEDFRKNYVEPILNGIEEHLLKNRDQPDRQRILLFVHGGLNGYDEGREHVLRLLEAQSESKKYPLLSSHYVVAINWEAGLKSALWDHFFEVRFGSRYPPLAIATSPFVFTNSVGQAVLNAPRDTWYAYGKDLWEKQLPNLGLMGYMSSITAAGYGGIVAGTTNLTFLGIMPQALAVAAAIYISPVVISDPTYYGFGPVRMLSAPIIDAFGRPAWEMLKRRPDLTLFNPQIYADEEVRGAGHILLQAISTKIGSKIQKTASGESRKVKCWETKSEGCLPVSLTLAGHSMGAMVGDRILQRFNDRLSFDTIVYMGAANTIADFQLSVIPYLKKHLETTFWAYSLTEEDEAAEKLPGDLLMRGSLLEWIDKLFEPPEDLLHYRFGKEKSQEYVIVDDTEIWPRICRITSSGDWDSDGNSKPGVPRKHGDFTDPKMVEKALSFVHKGCPTITDLNTASREALSHIPYIDENAIDAIGRHQEKKRIDDKEELVDAQIIPYGVLGCIAEYITPIDLNRATVTQISRLLHGDRFLASRIVAHRKDGQPLGKAQIERVLSKHIPQPFYSEIIGKIAFTFDDNTWRCRPPKSSVVARHIEELSRLVLAPYSLSRSRMIRNQRDEFQSKIISNIQKPELTTLISQRDWLREDSKSMGRFWSAVVDMAGKRIGLDIHVRAELGLEGNLSDWHKDPNVVRQHRATLTRRAKEDQLAAVFSIWDKDISKWPGFEENEAEIKQALGTIRFVSLSGTPESIAEAIFKEAQNLP